MNKSRHQIVHAGDSCFALASRSHVSRQLIFVFCVCIEDLPGAHGEIALTPVVRYMLLCDDARPDPVNPSCTHIDCLMGSIVSLEDPPFPLLREAICIYLVLTECHGTGIGQIRVAYSDSEPEQMLFGSPEHNLDFTGHSPLELLGFIYRLKGCLFPQAGRYSVQFWYNRQKIEELPLRLKAASEGSSNA